jgi:hypothetical protein
MKEVAKMIVLPVLIPTMIAVAVAVLVLLVQAVAVTVGILISFIKGQRSEEQAEENTGLVLPIWGEGYVQLKAA